MMRRMQEALQYSSLEWLALAVTSVVNGFFLSFRSWGEGEFDAAAGIESFILSSLLVFLCLLICVTVMKHYSGRKGFRINFQTNYLFLVIGFFITIASNGLAFILAPGWIEINTHKRERLGRWRHRPYFQEYGFMMQYGIFSLLILAGLVSGFKYHIFEQLTRIALFLAVFCLLPMPRYMGLHLFFAGGPFQYVFITTMVLVFTLLLFYVGFLAAFILALLLASVGYMIYFAKNA